MSSSSKSLHSCSRHFLPNMFLTLGYCQGLPDGLFSYQKCQYFNTLEGLGIALDKTVWLFHDNVVFILVTFIDNCYFCSNFCIFLPFWFLVCTKAKSANPVAVYIHMHLCQCVKSYFSI
jgi:hypothetical protein